MDFGNKMLLAGGLVVVGALALGGCEPSPKSQVAAWCGKYESNPARCDCIAKKVFEDLSKEDMAQLQAAIKADTSPTGSAGGLMSVIASAIGSGRAAVSLTAAAMTCR
jgi:hypothetical protein